MTMRPCWSGVTSWASAVNWRRASGAWPRRLDLGLELVGGVVEAVEGPEAEAAVELAQEPGLAELGADLGGQHHPALVVEPVLVGPDESGPVLCHVAASRCHRRERALPHSARRAPQDPSCVPLRANVCH